MYVDNRTRCWIKNEAYFPKEKSTYVQNQTPYLGLKIVAVYASPWKGVQPKMKE